MSIFKKVFGSSDNQPAKINNINWIQLTDLGQLNDIKDFSIKKPVIIFKHSTSCIVSKMALKSFEKEFDLQNDVEAYFLDLLKYRDISNEIATNFEVKHQSPQLLLIKNGISVYNTSHDNIDAEKLKERI